MLLLGLRVTFLNGGLTSFCQRRNNYNQSKKRMNGRAFRAQREDSIRRTVYVSDLDLGVSKDQQLLLSPSVSEFKGLWFSFL